MFDRDELIRGRIDTYLRVNRAPRQEVQTRAGALLVRQLSHGGVTVGIFAETKRELRRNPNYYIEVPIIGSAALEGTVPRKQLWLPAAPWQKLREITATETERSERFEAGWPAARLAMLDVEGYSKYGEAGEALLKEAKQALDTIGANNSGLKIGIVKDY